MSKLIEEFTREEYELLYNAFKHYRVFMDDEQEVMSERILDKIFYPSFDANARLNLKYPVADEPQTIDKIRENLPEFPRENWEAIT